MNSTNSSRDDGTAAHEAPDEAALPALNWMRRARAEEELLVEVARQVRRRRRRGLALATGALAAVMVAGLFFSSNGRHVGPTVRSVSSTAAIVLPERRTLPDGSVAEMKAGARIDIDFGGATRRVTLRQGEAHFQVTKNQARPFVVEAAGIKVRALGTAFSVQLDSKRVEVLVTEGQVQVAAPLPGAPSAESESPVEQAASSKASPDAARAEPILVAGHRAVIALDQTAPRIAVVSRAEIAEQLSWRMPSLEFSRTPLTEVVALMNEYAAGVRPVRFVIGSPELRELRLSGFLRADNSEGLVRLLESNFQVKAERAGDIVTLRNAQ